jgi:hypothetical protein
MQLCGARNIAELNRRMIGRRQPRPPERADGCQAGLQPSKGALGGVVERQVPP